MVWNLDDGGEPHCLEHMVFRGSRRHPAVGSLDALANMCMSSGTNAYTAGDRTVYTLSCGSAEGLQQVLPVYLDHVLYCALSAASFRSEVFHVDERGVPGGVVYSEMESAMSRALDSAYYRLLKLFYGPANPLSHNTGGAPAEIERLSLERVRQMHARHYHPDKLLLVLIGNVEPAPLLEALEFKPLQYEAIRALLGAKDVFCVFPTGGGKSLIFQLAALALAKCCLVVMPLISLMQDHGFIAVDEAHCISTWGNAFRPDYRNIGKFLQDFRLPKLALTASATDAIKRDIVDSYNMKDPHTCVLSVTRENIYYVCRRFSGDKAIDAELLNLVTCEHRGQAGIVYCFSRSNCQKIVKLLKTKNVSAAMYHAGMSAAARKSVQTHWMANRMKIIVATIAFGMGIDKPDVRFVIHLALPKSLDAFYQESGRAGRDGAPSTSYLL
uniref:DNA 3'-5' helicase n=1 Tax=Dermatophagoides pteronyssinus TaxID=6956 RepID=A0A6P6Y8N4_DERPT|nr:ATP-dependent DNA helicase Q-like 1 [Dermatophagoides pteronyssinus]